MTTTDLFLIAHRVRGEPAFDVAERMRCPNCQGIGGYKVADFETGEVTDYEGSSCVECDGLGYWWIIPTSGHRAYPFWTDSLQWYMDEMCNVPEMPSSCPDHYPTRHSSSPSLDISTLLAPAVKVKIERRF